MAQRSRRRRFLLQRTAPTEVAQQPAPEPSVPAGVVPAPPGLWSNQAFDPVQLPSGGLRYLQRLIRSHQPLTWVFTGPESIRGDQQVLGARNYSELFAASLRHEFSREFDVVINTASGTGSIENLVNNLHWRALRFRPNVVAVQIAAADRYRAIEQDTRYREELEQLVFAIRDSDALPVLLLPWHPLSPTDLNEFEILIAQVQAVVEQYDVACLGPGQYRPDPTPGLPDPTGIVPFPTGSAVDDSASAHARYARSLIQQLRFRETPRPLNAE